MPRICATISEKTEDDLKNIATKMRKPFSKIVSDMLELGLISYKNSQKPDQVKIQNNPTDLDLKHTEYLLRIINIDSEILRKLHNEPSKCNEKTVDLTLETIKVAAENHVKTKLKTQV